MLLETFVDRQGGQRLYLPEGLVARASAMVGRTPEDGEIDDTALARLCSAFETARAEQSAFGKIYVQRTIVDALAKRMRLTDYFRRFPEIGTTGLGNPLFIVAPFRTGTTFLHRLLAQDPDNRTARIWEVAYPPPAEPVGRGEARYFESDPRIGMAEAALRGLDRGNPPLSRVHPMGPHLAEECLGLLETALMSHSFMFYAHVPSYLQWLEQCSVSRWRDAYATYVQQLRLLSWFHPGKRWVLKSPVHLWNVDLILEAFPDAHVVQIHRDPTTVMASFCGLLAAYRGLLSKTAVPDDIGRQAFGYMDACLERNAAARKTRDASRFIDLRFDDLVRDPLNAVRMIYSRTGAMLSSQTEAAMRDWVSRSRSDPPASRPSVETFGLGGDAVLDAFSRYSRFAAEPAPGRPDTRA